MQLEAPEIEDHVPATQFRHVSIEVAAVINEYFPASQLIQEVTPTTDDH
jgi:hypothetical protein